MKRRFLMLGCLFLFVIDCTKEYINPVPSYSVYIEVDLTFRDKELKSSASSKIFTAKNTIHGKERTGYAGVLVTNSIFGGYKAFDIACPLEVRRDAVIEIDSDNNAVCKVCGSKFEIVLNYGSGGCINGISKYPLRQYRTSMKDNNTLIVRN